MALLGAAAAVGTAARAGPAQDYALNCMGCHGNAVGFQSGASKPKPGQVRLNQSDFTFMLEKAQ